MHFENKQNKPQIFKYFYNGNLYYGYGFNENYIKSCLCCKLNIDETDLSHHKGIVVNNPNQLNLINRGFVDYYHLGRKLNIDFRKLPKMKIQEIIDYCKLNLEETNVLLKEHLNVTSEIINSFDFNLPLEQLAKFTLNQIFIKTVKTIKKFNVDNKEYDITYESRIEEWLNLINKLIKRDPTIVLDFYSVEDQIDNLTGYITKNNIQLNIKEEEINLNNIDLQQDVKSLTDLEKILYLRKLTNIKNLYDNRLNNTYYFVNASNEYLFNDYDDFKKQLDKIYEKLITRIQKSYYKKVNYNDFMTLEEALYSYQASWLNDYKI